MIKKAEELADWYYANEVTKYDYLTDKWIIDDTQTVGASQDLALDADGNPAYISDNLAIYWKKDGTWTTKNTRVDCAKRIAFGGDGSLYKLGCALNSGQDMYKYIDGLWSKFSE